jgi:hypothetical protein
MIVLAAETTATDVIAGSAGWVGTGLLGSVLAWLLWVHLPAKDKQIKDIIDLGVAEIGKVQATKDNYLQTLRKDKDAQLNDLLGHKWAALQQQSADHREMIKVLAAEFKAVILETVNHCDKEIERVTRIVETIRTAWESSRDRDRDREDRKIEVK